MEQNIKNAFKIYVEYINQCIYDNILDMPVFDTNTISILDMKIDDIKLYIDTTHYNVVLHSVMNGYQKQTKDRNKKLKKCLFMYTQVRSFLDRYDLYHYRISKQLKLNIDP